MMEPDKTVYVVNRKDGNAMEWPYLFRLMVDVSSRINKITGRGWVMGSINDDCSEIELVVNYPDSYSDRIRTSIEKLLTRKKIRFNSRPYIL